MSKNSFSDYKFYAFITALLCLLFSDINAQNAAVLQTVSPYSRYGIGDFQMGGGMLNAGLGGGGIGYRNDSMIPQYINKLNPASLTSHQMVTYEVSFVSNTVQLNNAGSSAIFNRTTLGSIALAFPVKKWWGASIGLVPYTSVGYNVSVQDTLANLGPVTYKYEGSGGINQVYTAHAFRPFAGLPRRYILSEKYELARAAKDTAAIRRRLKTVNALSNISLGFNASYMFGSLTNVRRDVFPDSLQTFNTKITKNTLFRDLYISYGLQYSFRINRIMNPVRASLPDSNIVKTNWLKNEFTIIRKGVRETKPLWVKGPGVRVTFGAIAALPMELAVSYDLLAQTYKQVGTIEQFKDTAAYDNSIPSRAGFPLMAGFGFGFKKDYKWIFQADYTTQLWDNFTYLGVRTGLKNSQRVTAGFQFQPQIAGRGKYMQVVQYRIGARWHVTSLEINNTQLTEYAFNFGMALPVPYRSRLGEPIGRLNMTFEAGTRGTLQSGLIKENFLLVTIGLTINDRWFNRSKID